jgi:hypothetical protein
MPLRVTDLLLAFAFAANAQKIPDVSCTVEDYPTQTMMAWQSPQLLDKVQVIVLRDPAGEQEARFDLRNGASLLSLRYKGRELLYGHSAGADVGFFALHQPRPNEQKRSIYWTAFNPDQGGTSMGTPATVAGVSCNQQRSMRAFATMIDRSVDNSFQKDKLLSVWVGKIPDYFPPGYATPFAIETDASWVANPGKSPGYYLKLEQSVVNIRPEASGPLQWFLSAAAPWDAGNYASYPEACSEAKPCSSANTPALASGYYDDQGKTQGFATVVPTAPWRSPKAYTKANAEYVVLLYGAVWAAPRHTFANVLERPLDGLSAFRFSWYVCAGSWQQAQTFAAAQQKSNEAVLPVAPLPPSNPPDKAAVEAACAVGEFKMEPGQSDQVAIVEDPAREQQVLFDMAQGGAIVSLKYKGIEHVWGYNGGGLLQMAFHNGMTHGPWSGDYNPTQAGDGSAMSPVTGVACHGRSTIDITTMMLDFNHNNAFYDKPLIAVWNGRMNQMTPLSYFSPYTLETRASWIPDPAGEPKYYLKLEERFTHIADENVGPFTFDFAAYAPWEFPKELSGKAVGGFYREDESTGLGIAMPEKNFTHGKGGGSGTTEPMWRNHSYHLSGQDTVDGIASKSFVWYVLAGPWKNAVSFARGL